MKRTSFADWPCSIARTMEVLGDWWTPLVLRDAFLGVRRFDDFQHSLGIGRNILSQRLRHLVEDGLLERKQYQEHPARFEYRLTEKGRDFYPVLAAMIRWGDRWLDEGRGAPVILRHRTCGHVIHAEVICPECRQPLAPGEVMAEPGPGFPEKLLRNPDRSYSVSRK
jgi:DNA-binding HxlR family transcriptional regulator